MTEESKQVIIPIPFKIADETDIDISSFRSNINGTLIFASISLQGISLYAADTYVEIDLLLFRQRMTVSLISGYISAISGGTNIGLNWQGRLLLDTESGFGFTHYNKSGETQDYLLLLVIERE